MGIKAHPEFVTEAYLYAKNQHFKLEGCSRVVMVLLQSVQAEIILMNVALREREIQMSWNLAQPSQEIENRVKDQCKFEFRGQLLIQLKPLQATLFNGM